MPRSERDRIRGNSLHAIAVPLLAQAPTAGGAPGAVNFVRSHSNHVAAVSVFRKSGRRVIRDSRLSDLNFYKLLNYGGQPPPAARYSPLPCNGYCVECEAAGLVGGVGAGWI